MFIWIKAPDKDAATIDTNTRSCPPDSRKWDFCVQGFSLFSHIYNEFYTILAYLVKLNVISTRFGASPKCETITNKTLPSKGVDAIVK